MFDAGAGVRNSQGKGVVLEAGSQKDQGRAPVQESSSHLSPPKMSTSLEAGRSPLSCEYPWSPRAGSHLGSDAEDGTGRAFAR
jgi:hypothetical protein